MSANFYSKTWASLMLGFEEHGYFANVEGVPVLLADKPHTTLSNLRLCTKAASTVTAEGCPIWQEDGANTWSLHFPLNIVLGPPAHPIAEAAMLVVIHALCTTTARLAVHSVSGEGRPLACCIDGCFGINQNCSDVFVSQFSNLVLTWTSVVTQPTLGDFLWALAGIAVAKVVKWLFSKLGSLIAKIPWLKPILDRLNDALGVFRKAAEKLLGKWRSVGEKAFETAKDWIADKIRDLTLEWPKAIQERIDAVKKAIRGLVTAHSTSLSTSMELT
jgi:hypothetical protein